MFNGGYLKVFGKRDRLTDFLSNGLVLMDSEYKKLDYQYVYDYGSGEGYFDFREGMYNAYIDGLTSVEIVLNDLSYVSDDKSLINLEIVRSKNIPSDNFVKLSLKWNLGFLISINNNNSTEMQIMKVKNGEIDKKIILS